MAKKPEVIVKNSIQRKDFSYTLNETNLNFSLRVDNTSELRPFLRLLQTAVEEVEEEIKKLKN